MKKINMEIYSNLAQRAEELINDLESIGFEEFSERSADLLSQFNKENTILLGDGNITIDQGQDREQFSFISSLYKLLSSLVNDTIEYSDKVNPIVYDHLELLKRSHYYNV